MQSPTTKNQYYSTLLNETMPSSPLLGQPQQPSSNVFMRPQQPLVPQPASLNQRKELQSTIVGPSDHYEVQYHHQYNGATNNLSTTEPSNSQPNSRDETKVCVIVDSKTPVIFKIPQSPTRITLADLKQALPAINQPNYKYFFKSSDTEFGIVKEEIQDDYARLPTYRNRVVAWIVTPRRIGEELVSKSKSGSDTCNLTYSNTYDDCSSSLMTTDIESTSYFTETDDDSVSCSNYSETTCDTFISQRRNRHYKGTINSPNHHYRDHQANSPYKYDQHDRRRNLENISQSSSSSTSSSSSHSDATAVHCLTVHLVLTSQNFLGLHIYANAVDGIDEGIYVDGVTENSVVAIDGRIETGDKLIQVNETSLEELTNDEAVQVLKEAVIKRGPLKLVVAKFVETNKNDGVDGIVGSKDAIHPIDTAAWVAHAQAITIPNNHELANSATSSPSFGSNAQDTDCIRPASAGINRLNSCLRLNKNTTDVKEIIQHMRTPEIGLDIKDREWLKIHIPDAFLGSELILWLERNVYGFNSNRDAKKFASKLLKDGYIRDPISKKSFSSKSYYTLVI